MMNLGESEIIPAEKFSVIGDRLNTVNKNVFIRKHFDFSVPKEIETEIDNLEKAVLEKSSLLDCYLEEFRAIVHWNTDSEDGITEEQGEELIDYYYRRRYAIND